MEKIKYSIKQSDSNDFKHKEQRSSINIAGDFIGSKLEGSSVKNYSLLSTEEWSKDSDSNEFEQWIRFLEKESKNALFRKSNKENHHDIIKNLRNEIIKNYGGDKYNYIDGFLGKGIEETNISLPSLFNSIRFIHEISQPIIDRSIFFIDNDSTYVNMAFVVSESRVDLTFKENGEISFRCVDCSNGRIRITGSSFFGVGRNREETKKINRLFSLAGRGA